MRRFFVSDVHLSPSSRDRTERFARFLRSLTPRSDELYLLGDVFDYWIGPGHLRLDDYGDVLDLLRETTSRGVRVRCIVGNRDYLLCRGFERRTGVTLLGREAEIAVEGRRCLLTHGDFLYNRNSRYVRYRRVMDLPVVRAGVERIPPSMGGGIAKIFRAALGDRSAMSKKGYGWRLDRLLAPTKTIFARGIDTLICGHVHQPCHRTIETAGGRRQLLILGSWHGPAVYAVCEGGRFDLRSEGGGL